MKSTENKAFGIVGVKVELSFIELLLIQEQSRLVEQGGLLDTHRTQNPTPHRVALRNVVTFCEKLIYSNIGAEMEKTGNELFSPLGANAPLPLMSEEDLKNECDLNALENETHQ